MRRDAVSVSRSEIVMILLNFLTVECGQKGQQETSVFVIGHSAAIITFPWRQPTEEEVNPGKVIMNLVINLKQRILQPRSSAEITTLSLG